ncbi:MAG: polysaccharide biosynthesis protein [Sulfuricellaceae bacterium]
MKLTLFKNRAALAFIHDLIAVVVAWCAAFWLRFNFDMPAPYETGMLRTLLWVAPLQLVLFGQFGLYRGMWRYVGVHDLKRIVFAVGLGAIVLGLILVDQANLVPRSVLVLDPILLVLLMGGGRFAYRAWKEHSLYSPFVGQGEPVLVLGAGDAAVGLVKDLERSKRWQVVGLLDDDPKKHGRMLYGAKVVGGLGDVAHWAKELEVGQVIIAMPSVSHTVRKSVVEKCTEAGLKVMTVPALDDLVSGRVTVSQLRNIEVEDLLGRDPVVLDDAGLHSLLTGKVVMVTGAGGSIGSELCRQIARFKPGLLVLFELSEFALYRIEQEFSGQPVICVIGDVKDRTRLDKVLERYRPAVIFHAAAYKHVPLMERENAWEAVKNNVLGTHTLAQAAISHGVEKLVLISTDKAVNPANVMGATKRLAEMVCQGLQGNASTRFVMVRFGNVLASAGSVIPKFQEQIAKGGPVTVTHPEIVRYFMSIPEAAQLVLQAGLMGKGGEIFVMDMGEPVKIVDLARDMIRLSGFSDDEIRIVYTGLRPGEKLFEELLADDEHTLPTPHSKLRIARARTVDESWVRNILEETGTPIHEDAEVRRWLAKWVPEYTPSLQ